MARTRYIVNLAYLARINAIQKNDNERDGK